METTEKTHRYPRKRGDWLDIVLNGDVAEVKELEKWVPVTLKWPCECGCPACCDDDSST